MFEPNLEFAVLPFDHARASQVCILSGEFDKLGMEKIGQQFLDVTREFHGSYFIVDLEKLRFINSEGVGVLIGAYTHASKIGAKFFVVHPSSQVREILQTLGLWNLIGHSDSVESCYSVSP